MNCTKGHTYEYTILRSDNERGNVYIELFRYCIICESCSSKKLFGEHAIPDDLGEYLWKCYAEF